MLFQAVVNADRISLCLQLQRGSGNNSLKPTAADEIWNIMDEDRSDTVILKTRTLQPNGGRHELLTGTLIGFA